MTTRAEEIAGPYMVKKLGSPEGEYWYAVVGADGRRAMSLAMHEPRADLMAYALNAAYNQGQQDRWIPLSQFKAPAPGTIILFGSKATVRMWTWDANNDEPPSSWATHFQLIELPPNPEQR